MGIEVDGAHKSVTSDDGEVSVKAGSIHRFYIHPDSPGDMTVYLSASDAGMDYQLDRIFFENWYGYWHDALLHGGGLSLLQYLAVCILSNLTYQAEKCGLTCCKLPAVEELTSLAPSRSKTVEMPIPPRRPGSLSGAQSVTGPA